MKMGFCDLYSRGTIKSQKINANVRGPSGAGLPVWVWYYTMFLTIGVALENLGVSYFEFWPKSKWKCSIVMNFLYFPPKFFVLCLFHECVNTRLWRALFVHFWLIWRLLHSVKLKVKISSIFVAFSEYMNFTSWTKRKKGKAEAGGCCPGSSARIRGWRLRYEFELWTFFTREIVMNFVWIWFTVS